MDEHKKIISWPFICVIIYVMISNSFDELGSIGNGFHKVKDDNILRGMAAIQPIYHIFSKLPLAKKDHPEDIGF